MSVALHSLLPHPPAFISSHLQISAVVKLADASGAAFDVADDVCPAFEEAYKQIPSRFTSSMTLEPVTSASQLPDLDDDQPAALRDGNNGGDNASDASSGRHSSYRGGMKRRTYDGQRDGGPAAKRGRRGGSSFGGGRGSFGGGGGRGRGYGRGRGRGGG